MFAEAIREAYRVVQTRHGSGETEYTIPLGSWRKKLNLKADQKNLPWPGEGSRGHVYEYGQGWVGVWWKGRYSDLIPPLRDKFPDLRVMQRGMGECTFRIPIENLDAILPILKAKRRFKPSEAKLAACQKASESSPVKWRYSAAR